MAGSADLRRMQLVLDPWLEAEQTLEEACRLHPDFADLRYLRGLLFLEKHDAASALTEMEAALSINPGYRRARFGRMCALRMRDDALDPSIWNREGPISETEDPERSIWTAWFLAQRGDREGARSALTLLAGDPAWAGLAGYVRGIFEQAWGETRRAREAFAAAARAHPLYRSILIGRGLVAPARGAARAASPAPVAPPSDPSFWNPATQELFEHLGTLCARHGRPDEALPFYEEAFLRDGREPLHQIRLSQLALARGDEEEAVAALARAIEVDPTSVPARIALGFEYQSQGYEEQALIQFEIAARLSPSYPDVQYNLGLLYAAQGRSKDAERRLRRALEIHPRYFQARASLAQILLQREAFSEALVELDQLLQGGIRSADLHVQKAQAHLACDQPQEALGELEAAVAVNPCYARTYYVLGQAYRQLGLRRKARSAWQQYLERSRSWREQKPAPDGEEWRR